MATKTVKTRIQQKHDFEILWLKATTFVPYNGEIIVYNRETDPSTGAILKTKISGVDTPVVPVTTKDGQTRTTAYNYNRFKIGDGVTNVNDLPFADSNVKESLISSGTADPNADTGSQFYFKYSN